MVPSYMSCVLSLRDPSQQKKEYFAFKLCYKVATMQNCFNKLSNYQSFDVTDKDKPNVNEKHVL